MLFPWLLMLEFGGCIKLYIIISIILQICVFTVLCKDFKIIKICETGCTVKLFFIKKNYQWTDLQIQIIEDYHAKIMGRNDRYKKCVKFIKYKEPETKPFSKILRFMDTHFNPLSSFIILFRRKNEKDNITYYEADETEFMQKMAEYGVELQTQ